MEIFLLDCPRAWHALRMPDRISESLPRLNAEDNEKRSRILLQIKQGLEPTQEEWLWLLTAELALSETRQDRGYDLAP